MRTPITWPKERQSVAWECFHCGKRHRWTWDSDDVAAVEGLPVTMQCEGGCLHLTNGMRPVRIGLNAWAMAWPEGSDRG